MSQIQTAWHRLTLGLGRVLPPHQFTWHRADGPKSLTIGTGHQAMAVGTAVAVAGWLGIATSAMVTTDTDATLLAKQAELDRMQSQLVQVKTEAASLKGEVAARAEALEARHQFLAALLSGKGDPARLAKLLPRATSGELVPVTALLAPAKGRKGKGQPVAVALNLPAPSVIEPFRRLESEQLAFVDKASVATEARLRDTQALLRRLGLDPSRFTSASDLPMNATAMGGPFIPASSDLDPRFRDLYINWRKLSTLQAAVAAVPAFMPVKSFQYTSGYGFRFDPFNGGSAMHAGVDMAGSHGEPIYASASGVVSKAGVASGYGNLVELSHGKGIDTRYGHLSKILVRPGEYVRQGQLIARMGSTGRSTGTHLHYEIRIDGRAVNPRPFLESSSFVLAAQGQQGPMAPDEQFGPLLDNDEVVTASAEGTAGARMTPIRFR